jgi:hypothetical protein
MAIVDDIKKDRRTRNVLAQTNTKTVSAPPASTGLTGDQTPASVFSVDDFDLIKNQVHLEEKNFQLMEALNTMGQLTNMQSQSGPIPGTSKIHDLYAGDSSNPFTPHTGEVWLLAGGTVKSVSSSAGRAFVLLEDSNITDMELADESWTAGQQNAWDPISGTGPFYIDANTTLKVSITFTSGSSARIYAYLIRVR